MKPFMERRWFTLLILSSVCITLNAHPGDNGYWLIEISESTVVSRVLLPDHVFVHLLGLKGDEDRIRSPDDLMDSQDQIIAILKHRLTLEGQRPLVQRGSSAVQRKPGGFFELASTYTLPGGTRGLSLTSTVEEIIGEDMPILCRVVGAKPETFVLDALTSPVKVTPDPDASFSRPNGSVFHQARQLRFYGLLILLILGLALLGLRFVRLRQIDEDG